MCYNMDESWKHYAKWKKANHKRTNTIWFHLYEVPSGVKFIETESRMVVAKGWRKEGIRNCCLMGTEFQFWEMKTVLELDGGYDCITVWLYLKPLNYTVNDGYMVSFVLCIFYHNKKKQHFALDQERFLTKKKSMPIPTEDQLNQILGYHYIYIF